MDGGAEGWGGCQGDRGRGGSRPELAGARKRRHQDAQGLRSASPKVLETVGRQHAMQQAVRKNPAEGPCRKCNEFNARLWYAIRRFSMGPSDETRCDLST